MSQQQLLNELNASIADVNQQANSMESDIRTMNEQLMHDNALLQTYEHAISLLPKTLKAPIEQYTAKIEALKIKLEDHAKTIKQREAEVKPLRKKASELQQAFDIIRGS